VNIFRHPRINASRQTALDRCNGERAGLLSGLEHTANQQGKSARRDRLLAAIVVKTALRLAAEPSGLDVFHQQRARPVFRIRQAFVQDLHHRKASVEPDEIGKLERPHRVMGAEPHRGVDRLDVADAKGLVQPIT
jgi:hypothetical protein